MQPQGQSSNRYQVLVVDIDGTAINSPDQKVASARLTAATKRLIDLGVVVCAATGRSEVFAEPVITSMGLKHPMIVSGGSRIIDPITRRELWGCFLSSAQMEGVVQVFSGKDMRFLRNEWTDDQYLGGAYPLEEFLEYEKTYIFVACFVHPEDVDELQRQLMEVPGVNAIVATSHMSGRKDIHVTHANASKEHAVHELEGIIGVDRSSMIGIGDGQNDVHLFDAVGYKVAMQNADENLKEAADKVIGDVQDDGLAEYFEKLIKEIGEGR